MDIRYVRKWVVIVTCIADYYRTKPSPFRYSAMKSERETERQNESTKWEGNRSAPIMELARTSTIFHWFFCLSVPDIATDYIKDWRELAARWTIASLFFRSQRQHCAHFLLLVLCQNKGVTHENETKRKQQNVRHQNIEATLTSTHSHHACML